MIQTTIFRPPLYKDQQYRIKSSSLTNKHDWRQPTFTPKRNIFVPRNSKAYHWLNSPPGLPRAYEAWTASQGLPLEPSWGLHPQTPGRRSAPAPCWNSVPRCSAGSAPCRVHPFLFSFLLIFVYTVHSLSIQCFINFLHSVPGKSLLLHLVFLSICYGPYDCAAICVPLSLWPFCHLPLNSFSPTFIVSEQSAFLGPFLYTILLLNESVFDSVPCASLPVCNPGWCAHQSGPKYLLQRYCSVSHDNGRHTAAGLPTLKSERERFLAVCIVVAWYLPSLFIAVLDLPQPTSAKFFNSKHSHSILLQFLCTRLYLFFTSRMLPLPRTND